MTDHVSLDLASVAPAGESSSRISEGHLLTTAQARMLALHLEAEAESDSKLRPAQSLAKQRIVRAAWLERHRGRRP